mmetsp:Transcript_30653/g.89108  ORF Transcript_30653/g.89108 Transcript_30653/m.89108 type:complete len:216 (+) Transcript_30653:614-1261(+)
MVKNSPRLAIEGAAPTTPKMRVFDCSGGAGLGGEERGEVISAVQQPHRKSWTLEGIGERLSHVLLGEGQHSHPETSGPGCLRPSDLVVGGHIPSRFSNQDQRHELHRTEVHGACYQGSLHHAGLCSHVSLHSMYTTGGDKAVDQQNHASRGEKRWQPGKDLWNHGFPIRWDLALLYRRARRSTCLPRHETHHCAIGRDCLQKHVGEGLREQVVSW